MSTAYLISSKVIKRGSKGRTIPRFLFGLTSLMLPTLEDNVLDDILLRLSFPLSEKIKWQEFKIELRKNVRTRKVI